MIRVRLNRDQLAGDVALKSGAGRRDVPILAALRPILIEHVALLGLDSKPDDVAAPGPRGCLDADRYLERCRKVWAKARLEPLGLHDARHTCASLLIASGANIKQISRMMGHSSITVTLDVYGHLLRAQKRRPVRRWTPTSLGRSGRRHTLLLKLLLCQEIDVDSEAP